MSRDYRKFGGLQFENKTVEERKQGSRTNLAGKIVENLLSVIIPVYNAEEKIKICVESVLGQTYRNMELILVDDGSTDTSPDICDEFAAKDSRVKVYHIVNSGPSVARNMGLLHMRGQYLAFVDADDFLELDMYEYLIQSIRKEKVQMAVCNWMCHNVESGSKEKSDIGAPRKSSSIELREIISSENVKCGGGFLWNRVIDWKAVVEAGASQIWFPCGVNVYEDKIWILQVLKFMKEIIILSECKYHYMIEDGSLSHRRESDRILDFIEAWKLIDEEFLYQLPFRAKKARQEQTLQILWDIVKERKLELLNRVWPECEKIVKSDIKGGKSLIKYCIVKWMAREKR